MITAIALLVRRPSGAFGLRGWQPCSACGLLLLGTLLSCTVTAPITAQQTPSTLILSVFDAATYRPLPGAQVTLSPSRAGGVTDAAGALRIAGLAPGAYTVRVRFLGYRGVEQEISLGAGAALERQIFLEVAPVELAEVRVETRARRIIPGAMQEFETRRERGIGRFITRADIDRQRPRQFSDLMRLIPGMRLSCHAIGSGCRLGVNSAPESQSPERDHLQGSNATVNASCPIQYYVDGVYQPYDDINEIRPDDVQGIEIYAHGQGAPARYSVRKSARCGVVLIWMRYALN